ncbi:MAG: CotH kinase family protein [Oligoflexus sp.]|nr:CotH kinase family protein [Oligoflexus sp.]
MNLLQGLKLSFISKHVAVALAFMALFSSSCKGIHFNEENSYGLRLVSLDITPEEYGLLNGQLLSKRPAAVEVKVAGEFEVNCSASYAGRSSLDSYRKSFDLNFCDKKYNQRSHYRLSAQVIDKTMVRSLMGYDLFKAMDLETVKAEAASAYINSKYLGVYIFMETIDKEFFKARKLNVEGIYKARYANAGFRQDYASKVAQAFSYDGKGKDDFTSIDEIYKVLWLEPMDDQFGLKIDKLLDIDSFLSYAAVALYIEHWDGFDNNYFLAFDIDKKKLVTVAWDLDRIWEKPEDYAPEDLLSRNALLARLLKIPAYHRTFITKVNKLNGDFPSDKLIAMAQKYEEKSREAYGNDPILSRYQKTAFEELQKNISAWSVKIEEYLGRNPL